MGPPNDAAAKAAGFRILGDTTQSFGGYQSSVYTTRRSWAAAHRGELIALISALVEAHRYIFAEDAGAFAILRARLPALSEPDAKAIYRDLISERGRFNVDGRIEVRDVEVVLDLRKQFALSPHPEAKASEFYDLSYLDAALARLRT
jgi:ABC-type nitrate/sulfonate/bicarbonate transport system substrate-binding protein